MSTIVYVSPQVPASTLTPYRSLVRTVAPAVEPISVSEAKAHLRVDTDADDTYIGTLITVAREYCEERLDATFIESTWVARYDVFPLWELLLPRPPMVDSNVSITYRDEGGNNQTITSSGGDFRIDAASVPGRVYPNYEEVWPAVRGDENSVAVTYKAGYGTTAADVPAIIKHAILLLCGVWYAAREPVTTGTTAQNMPIPYTFETLISMGGWGNYR